MSHVFNKQFPKLGEDLIFTNVEEWFKAQQKDCMYGSQLKDCLLEDLFSEYETKCLMKGSPWIVIK